MVDVSADEKLAIFVLSGDSSRRMVSASVYL